MTTQELINYYANLLISQYVGKPNAYAHMQTLVTPVIMDQLPLQVQNAYNLTGSSPAIGPQLDVLGKYAGVTRTVNGFSGPITLSDSDFLSLILLAIVTNNAGSSLYDIQSLLQINFAGQIFVFDYANGDIMRMSYFISSSVGSQNLVEAFVAEGLLPHPMGVELGITVYFPVINTFFGFRTYDAPGMNNSPFNTYDVYNNNSPWLSYSDGVLA